jgi:hypothetical protein
MATVRPRQRNCLGASKPKLPLPRLAYNIQTMQTPRSKGILDEAYTP